MHGILDNMEYYGILVIICNNNNSTGSNEDGGSLHVGRHSPRGIDGKMH